MTPSSPNDSRNRRPISSAASTATTGWPTAGTSRSRSTPRATRSTRSRRTTGTCSGAASSTSPRRKLSSPTSSARGCSRAGACARSPKAKAATTRSATTSARCGPSTTRSSRGAWPVRIQGRSGCDRRGHLGGGGGFRRAPARGFRRLRALAHEVSGPIPHCLQPPGMVDRRAAPPPSDDARAGAGRRASGRGSRTPQEHWTARTARHPGEMGSDRRLRPRARRRWEPPAAWAPENGIAITDARQLRGAEEERHGRKRSSK